MSGTIYRDSENKEETLAPYSKEERNLWDEVCLATLRSGNNIKYAVQQATLALEERRKLFGRQEEF